MSTQKQAELCAHIAKHITMLLAFKWSLQHMHFCASSFEHAEHASIRHVNSAE